MLIDSLVSFSPIGSNLSLVAGVGISVASNVLDLLGAGVGVAPPNIIGNATLFGEESGLGAIKPQVQVNVGVAPVANTGTPTLNIAFQAAPDTAVTFLPGTWQTLVETGPLTVAQLAAAVAKYPVARFDWPPAFPPGLQPRYLRLLYQIPAGTNFSAGTIASAIVTMVRDDLAQRYAANNFTVGALA